MNLKKRVRQIQHWVDVLESTSQTTQSTPEDDIQSTPMEGILTTTEDASSDLGIDLPATARSVAGEVFHIYIDDPINTPTIQPATEQDFFSTFEYAQTNNTTTTQSASDHEEILSAIDVDLTDLESINDDFESATEQHPQPITEQDIFSNFEDNLTNLLTTQAVDDREDSLSDIDIDLDDLDSIPEDFAIPILNEDGLPMDESSDTESDNTNTDTNGDNQEDTSIRNLMISVQGNDIQNAEIERTLYLTLFERTSLYDITKRSGNGLRNAVGVGEAARQEDEWTRWQMHGAEIRMPMMARNDAIRIWGQENINKENVDPARVKRREHMNRGTGNGSGSGWTASMQGWTRMMR